MISIINKRSIKNLDEDYGHISPKAIVSIMCGKITRTNIHDAAIICDNVSINSDSSIKGTILKNSKLGKAVKIEKNCVIGEGAILGDFIYVNEGCDIGGGVSIPNNTEVHESINKPSDVFFILNCGNSNSTVVFYNTTNKVSTGCFYGTIPELKQSVIKKYGSNYGTYADAIEILESL